MATRAVNNLIDLIRFFGERDRNRSGKLEAEELSGLSASSFRAMDANGDAGLSPREFAAGRLSPSIIAGLDAVQRMGYSFPNLLLEEDAEINGVWYQAHHRLKFHPNGQVAWGVLAKPLADPQSPKRYYKAETPIAFHANGRVKSAILAHAARIYGTTFMADTNISFHQNGRVWSGTVLEALAIPPHSIITFRDNGDLYDLTLGADQRLREILFPAGTRLVYRNSCHTVSALPSQDVSTPWGVFQAGEKLIFDEIEHVREGVLAQDLTRDGITYGAGTRITFYDSGEVREGTPVHDFMHGKRMLLSGHPILRNRGGSVIKGVLGRKVAFRDMIFKADERVSLSSGGEIRSGILASPLQRKGLFFPKGTELFLRDDGTIIKAVAPPDVLIRVLPFERHFTAKVSTITFHPNGKPRRMALADPIQLPVRSILSAIPLPNSMLLDLVPDQQIHISRDGHREQIALSDLISSVMDRHVVRMQANSISVFFDEHGRIVRIDLTDDYSLSRTLIVNKDQHALVPAEDIPIYDDLIKVLDRELARANP